MEIQPRLRAPPRINHSGDTTIGHTQHRQTQLDGAGARLGKMLRRALPLAKPSIIGNQHQKIGARRPASHKLRKNPLIADQRLEPADPFNINMRRATAGGKFWKIIAKDPSQMSKGYIFPEGHQTALVIFTLHLPLRAYHAQGVEILARRIVALIANHNMRPLRRGGNI
ncbi:hypothetical protein OAC57_02295 [Planktomarina temperata]|nr:hypothetical protein [Planktomarina temperata]